jgi:hypothetical protein
MGACIEPPSGKSLGRSDSQRQRGTALPSWSPPSCLVRACLVPVCWSRRRSTCAGQGGELSRGILVADCLLASFVYGRAKAAPNNIVLDEWGPYLDLLGVFQFCRAPPEACFFCFSRDTSNQTEAAYPRGITSGPPKGRKSRKAVKLWGFEVPAGSAPCRQYDQNPVLA